VDSGNVRWGTRRGRKPTGKKDHIAKGLSLLTVLENDPQSQEFRQPVDYIGMGLLDYPAIVKKLMDISTVKVSGQLIGRKS
jgi:hypothetical protein